MLKCLLILILGSAILFVASNPRAAECDTVKFETVYQSQQTGIEEARDFVIRTDSAWTGFWKNAHRRLMPSPEPPEIDFSKRIVIVTAAGQKPNSCYSTAIRQIQVDTAGNYMVQVADIKPPPEMVCLQVIVLPVHAVSAPIPEGEVRFLHSGMAMTMQEDKNEAGESGQN